MIDLGEIEPTSALGPTRSSAGVSLPRLTTSEEQRQEVIEQMTAAATEHKESVVRAKVLWSRGEPTILEQTFQVEHLSGRRVWMPDRLLEMTLAGAEIPRNEQARLRQLTDEVTEMHDRAML